MKPKSYRYQNSCVNCAYGHLFHPLPDEGLHVVCLFKDEVFPEFDQAQEFNFDTYLKYTIKRDDFVDPREVAENGYCDKWKDCDKKKSKE